MKTKNKILLGLGATVALVGTAGVESFASELTGSTITTASYQATGKFVQKIEYVSKTVYDSTTKTNKVIRIGQPDYYFQTGNQLIPLAKNDALVVRKYGTTQAVTVYGKMVTESGKRVLDIDRVSQATVSYQGTGKFVQKTEYTRDRYTGRVYYKIHSYFQTGNQLIPLADNDYAVVRKYGTTQTVTVFGKMSYPEGKPLLDVDAVRLLPTEERFTGKIIERAKYEVRSVYDAKTQTTKRIYVKNPEFYFQTATKMYKLADNDRAVAYKYGVGKTLTVTGTVLNSTSYPVLDIDKVLNVATLPVK